MNWRFYVTSREERTLDFCCGSMDDGDGEGCGYGIADGGDLRGLGFDTDGDGYGDGWGDGRGDGYGDGTSPEEWA